MSREDDTKGNGCGAKKVGAPALLITGPTASGKSDLAMYMAERLGALIVNADSVQFYRGFDIGSAKPTKAEQQRVPHALIDCCGPEDEWIEGDAAGAKNMAGSGMDAAKFYDQYLRLATEVRAGGGFAGDALQSLTNCLVVGSSGLYLSALLKGLSDLPSADKRFRESLAGVAGPELWARLQEIDPARAAQLAPHDRARIVRSLEVSLLTNSSYTDALRRTGALGVGEVDGSSGEAAPERVEVARRAGVPALVVVLVWPREQLYARIEERTRKMFAAGLVDEVKGLIKRYPAEHQALRAIGYKEVVAGLKAGASEEEMRAAVAQATRQYAKRQMTFWRNEPIKQGWACSPDAPWVKLGRCLEARPLELSREQLLERVAEKLSGQLLATGESFIGPKGGGSGRGHKKDNEKAHLDSLEDRGGAYKDEKASMGSSALGASAIGGFEKRGTSVALSRTEVWYCSGFHVTN